ncbi:MAG: 2-amino-4-hydroxy-6-hydroxymethyldihydropteridine diphosphokinase [Chloroflexi bacterium]|nr:2-amino-4-hydroxy-6-hydroxymethyldihydropteridine diphosphokinase [Chloroflexota bacterium]
MSAGGKTERVYLALGSNIEPERHLRQAVAELRARFPILAISSVWRTPPVGGPGPDYLNAALGIECELPLRALKYRVLRPLEAAMGRVRRKDKNAPRVIDIDPIIFGKDILDPEIWTQAHLAVPLAELLPGLVRPLTGEGLASVADLLRHTADIQHISLSL